MCLSLGAGVGREEGVGRGFGRVDGAEGVVLLYRRSGQRVGAEGVLLRRGRGLVRRGEGVGGDGGGSSAAAKGSASAIVRQAVRCLRQAKSWVAANQRPDPAL